jgi:hypothetical protein
VHAEALRTLGNLLGMAEGRQVVGAFGTLMTRRGNFQLLSSSSGGDR